MADKCRVKNFMAPTSGDWINRVNPNQVQIRDPAGRCPASLLNAILLYSRLTSVILFTLGQMRSKSLEGKKFRFQLCYVT